MKHIIYKSEPDYEGAKKYIEDERESVAKELDELEKAGWLGSVLRGACEKKLEELETDEAYNISENWREDERANLDEETGEIVIVADLGLWNGRVAGVKSTGEHNLNAILGYHGDVDDIEVYEEDGEVKGAGYHHDGTNYYTFREVVDEEKWNALAEKIANGESWTKEELDGATKSLSERVNKVYGW